MSSGSVFTLNYGTPTNCTALTLSFSRDQVNWTNSTGGCTTDRQLDTLDASGTWYFRLTQICSVGEGSSNIVSYTYTTPTPTPTPTSTPTPTPTPTTAIGQCYLIVVPSSYNTTGYGIRLQLPGQISQDYGFNQLLAEVGPLDEAYYYVCSAFSPQYVNINTGVAQTYPEEITFTGPNGGCVSHADCINPEPTSTPTPTPTSTPTPTVVPGTPCIEITSYDSQDTIYCMSNNVPYYYTTITALLTDGNGNAMNAVGDVYAYANITENILYHSESTSDWEIKINNGTSSAQITVTTSIPVDNGQGGCETETRVINSYSAQPGYNICTIY